MSRPQAGASLGTPKPILKPPTWTWEIPCYFYAGGLAGASAGLAFSAGLRGNEALARTSWRLALGGLAVSPPLLIADLGRPGRFFNMLRMFKATSPMSVGSWILTGFGASTTLAALGFRPAQPVAAAFGLPLASYTGALVATTSIPVWHEARRELPFLFVAGAAASAGAGAVALLDPADARPARRLAIGAGVAELALKKSMERRLGPAGEPYKSGAAGRFGKAAEVAFAAGIGVLAGGGRSRAAGVVGGALISAGALATRWSVYKAGFQSVAATAV